MDNKAKKIKYDPKNRKKTSETIDSGNYSTIDDGLSSVSLSNEIFVNPSKPQALLDMSSKNLIPNDAFTISQRIKVTRLY